MTELPIQRLLLELLAMVERCDLPYAIMGGFAVRTWGIPRPTYDADLALAADPEALAILLSTLRQAGFDVPQEHQKGFRDRLAGMEKVKVTRFEQQNVWEIDIFLAADGILCSAIGRRRKLLLAGRPVWVMAPEDIILLKLLAYRRKDQLDVEEILRITSPVDQAYLFSWADRLGVADRLRTFLEPEGGPPRKS